MTAVRPERLRPVGACPVAVRPRAPREHPADSGERLGAASVRDGPDALAAAMAEDALAFHEAHPVSDRLEIETHAWGVLPDRLKTGDITGYVVRGLEWVQGKLA